jgi:tRNA pseudouridine-54 N-methylase
MDSYLVFLRKPLASRLDKIYLKGYASRYSRLDVLARITEALSHPRLTPRQLYAFIPMGDERNIVVLRFKHSCTLGGEPLLTVDAVKAAHGMTSKCFEKLEGYSIKDILALTARTHTLALLHEEGIDFHQVCSYRRPIAWALGGHQDPPEWLQGELVRLAKMRVSIGPHSYLASQVVTYTCWAREACLASRRAK